MFKKHHWTPYGRKAIFLDLKVKDQTEQVIDSIRLEKGKNVDNERRLKKLKRYGFDLVQGEQEKKPEEEMAEEKKKDMDWLSKDIEW